MSIATLLPPPTSLCAHLRFVGGMPQAKANIHIGNIGLAPAYESPVDSVPPLMSGG